MAHRSGLRGGGLRSRPARLRHGLEVLQPRLEVLGQHVVDDFAMTPSPGYIRLLFGCCHQEKTPR